MENRRVFVTGIGIISSIGIDRQGVLSSLRDLKHGFSVYQEFEDDPLVEVSVVSKPKEFNVDSIDCEDWEYPANYKIRRDVLRGLAPHGIYAYCAMKQAIEDAKLEDADISNPDTGIYTASAGSPRMLHNNMLRLRQRGAGRCPPTSIVCSISGTLSFNLVANFKINGNSCGFSSACASSGHALGYAFDDIALGRQKRMFVTAGEDANYESIVPFCSMRALSLESDPDRASCPFDLTRNGFVSAGGGAVLVLESEDEVLRRGATPYAEVLGWGQSSDGHNVAISHPEGYGLARAMSNAMAASQVEKAEIDYINAHATSTSIGDASEGRAIQSIFTNDGCAPKVSSTKAITGHGLSLASALEASIVSLSIKEGITPGSANIKNLDPEFSALNIIRETEESPPVIAMSNSSGFGGANVSVIFKKA